MSILIIYTSVHHKNTEKIAKAMAESINADIKQAGEVNAGMLDGYDIIGFGSGIYLGKHHKNLIGLIESLPDNMNKIAFAFSTSGWGKSDYNRNLEILLAQKGFKVIPGFSCKGYDTSGPLRLIGGISKGHPDDDEVQKARAYAKTLV